MIEIDYKLVLDAFADAVIASDGLDRVIYCNAAVERLLGWSPADLMDHPLTTIMPTRMQALHRAGFERYTASHVPRLIGRPVRVPALRRDGTEVEIELTLTAYRLAEGRDLVVASLRDLHDRVELERQLAVGRYLQAATRAAARLSACLELRQVLDATTDALVQDFDAAMACVWLPDAATGALTLSACAGPALDEGREAGSYPVNVSEVLGSGRPFVRAGLRGDPRFDQEWVAREGLVAAAVYPLTIGGELRGALACFFRRALADEVFDVLETLATTVAATLNDVQLFAREQVARAEAESASTLKDEFLATISHELRTPLTAIVGWAHILRGGRADAQLMRRGLETIERNATAQSRLVEDMLDVSRIITGKLQLEFAAVDPAPLVRAALATVSPMAQAKDVTVRALIEPGVADVTGDAGRLQQIAWNLLSNALKFTPKGGEVTVRLGSDGSTVRLEVEDTGQGIPRAMLPYIFDRFRQADSSTTRAHGGLGLGLAIVRHLVELHGGAVSAESRGEGLGARFTVSLPARPPDAPRAPASAPPEVAAVLEPPPRLDGVRALVVDDDDDARDLVREVLAGQGATVLAVGSAAEALDAFATFGPSVLVSDIGMPGEDGYGLIAKVRALPPEGGGRVPAVALTAYARPEDRRKTLVAGFQRHVAKPIEPPRLLAIVASLVAHAAPA